MQKQRNNIWGPGITVDLRNKATREKLDRIAFEQDRTTSSLVRIIVEQWLKRHDEEESDGQQESA